jgi:hypothetical protein
MELDTSRLVQISKVVIEEVIACSKNIEAMQGRQGAYVCASDFNGTARALIATGAIPNPEKRRKYCRIAQKKCYDLALLDLLLVGRPSVKSTRAYADPEVERYVGGIVGASLVFATSGFTGDLDEVVKLHRWLKTGSLALRCPHPSGAIVDALDEFASALSAREANDLDKLSVTIDTDGTISPRDAFEEAAAILVNQYAALAGKTRLPAQEATATVSEGVDLSADDGSLLNTSIEDLNLTARTTNALINNDIHTIQDLFALSDAELRDLKGFGSKALDEVKDKLAELEQQHRLIPQGLYIM